MSLSIILPATDETEALKTTVDVLFRDLGESIHEIIIVTSKTLTTNDTKNMIKLIKKIYKEKIIDIEQNLPKLGGAYRNGFAKASGEYVILMASDLETDPNSAVLLFETIKNENADIVSCSRWLTNIGFSGYNPIKYISNFIFQGLFRFLYKVNLTDLTFGYRIFKTSLVKNIEWEELDFSFIFETLIKPIRLNKEVIEIPSKWNKRYEGKSHINLRSYLHYFKIGFKTLFYSEKKS